MENGGLFPSPLCSVCKAIHPQGLPVHVLYHAHHHGFHDPLCPSAFSPSQSTLIAAEVSVETAVQYDLDLSHAAAVAADAAATLVVVR